MTPQARLPERLYEPQIKLMTPGSSAYTMPWGMFVDEDGRLWLNGNYTLHDRPRDTAQMLVKRRVTGGYEVDISRCRDHGWSPGASYVGDFEAIPVKKLLGAGKGS